MLRPIIVATASCMALFLGYLILRSGPTTGSVQSETGNETPVAVSPKSAPREELSAERSKRPHYPEAAVTLDEIAHISSSADTTILYQRISVELIDEILRLKDSRDAEKIRSRLTPTAQKFHYLQRVSGLLDGEALQRLPDSFRGDVATLEDIWTENTIMARTVDDLFSRLDILLFEHVPYQLRKELVLQ